VLFNMYYTVKISQKLKKIWKKYSRQEPQLPVPSRAGTFVKIVLYIGIDYSKFEGKSAVIILFRIIMGIVLFAIRTAIKIAKTLLKQGTSSVFAAIDFV
jgi:hypothetical protein